MIMRRADAVCAGVSAASSKKPQGDLGVNLLETALLL
jgi:hypothetical protein